MVTKYEAMLECERSAAAEFFKKKYPNWLGTEVRDEDYLITLEANDKTHKRYPIPKNEYPEVKKEMINIFKERFEEEFK